MWYQLNGVPKGIRTLNRGLRLHGLVSKDLAPAVPSFANWRLSSVSIGVPRDDLERLVAAADPSVPIGMRDQALLLCMTELGMRATDIAALEIDGVDFAAQVLRFRRPKQRKTVELPMTARLAKALGRYLRHGRPGGSSAFLFVIHRAPCCRRLSPLGIHGVVIRRATQAGLAGKVRG